MFAQDFDAASFKKGFDRNLENAFEVRMAVRQAKKYSLDTNASRLLFDMALIKNWPDMRVLRQSARSPHSKMWVEFNNAARRERLIELTNNSDIATPDEVFRRLGWLIETHPKQPSLHRMTLALDFDHTAIAKGEKYIGELSSEAYGPHVMPFSFEWDTEDKKSLWEQIMLVGVNSERFERRDFSDVTIRDNIPELATGIIGYKDEFIALSKGFGKMTTPGKYYSMLNEFAGELRYVFAFLASMASEKVVNRSNVRTMPSKHASGRTLPAYEFTEVRITLPKKRRLGPYLVTHGNSGIKKRNHDVERHWRSYQHGNGPFCLDEKHTWELSSAPNKQYCTSCSAWRTWVKEHERGDKTLGRVEHAKRVTAPWTGSGS